MVTKKIQKKKQKKAFTLIELIVVITILAILGTIAFVSLKGYGSRSRDSARLTDVGLIKKSLELHSVKVGNYPNPTNGIVRKFEVSAGNELDLWNQGTFNDDMFTEIGQMSKKPVDPLDSSKEYVYSKASNSNEFEILVELENNSTASLGGTLNALASDGVYTLNKIEGSYNGYYVVGVNPSTRVLSLVAVPTIISGTPNGSLTEDGELLPNVDANIIIPGEIKDEKPKVKLNEVYSGESIPRTPEQVEEFTKNLIDVVESNMINNPSLKNNSEFGVIISTKPADINSPTINEKLSLQELGKNILGGMGASAGGSFGGGTSNSCVHNGITVPNGTTKPFFKSSTSTTIAGCSQTDNKKEFKCYNGNWVDLNDASIVKGPEYKNPSCGISCASMNGGNSFAFDKDKDGVGDTCVTWCKVGGPTKLTNDTNSCTIAPADPYA